MAVEERSGSQALQVMETALSEAGLELSMVRLVIAESAQLCATEDQKALMDRLKVIGISKMGARQRAARILREMKPSFMESPDLPGAPSAPPVATDLDSFWSSLIEANEDSMSAGDLGAVQLDAADYAQPMRVLSRAPRQMTSSPPDVAVCLEKRAASYPGCAADDKAFRPNLSETMSTYRERGNAAFSRKDYDTAESWYEKVISLAADVNSTDPMQPDHASALSNLAACVSMPPKSNELSDR